MIFHGPDVATIGDRRRNMIETSDNNKDIKNVILNKDLEVAIIQYLATQKDKKLSAGQIKRGLERYNLRENDNSIQKKIERMAEKSYLHKEVLTSGKYLYYLNKGINFRLEGSLIESGNNSAPKTTEAENRHNSDLREAIQAWIDNFTEPSHYYPEKRVNRSSSVIAACERHPLFSDLANHLPGLDSNICDKWGEYKQELIKLDRQKEDLFSSLKSEILRCFEGINLTFIYDGENYLKDYECSLNPLSLYNVVMELSSDEGYDNHLRFLSWLQCNAPFVEKTDHILWGNVIPYLRVPKNDRTLLEAGVSRFIAFFEDIPILEFPEKAKEIKTKVDTLKQERDQILSELKRILFYTNYPGECKYMK
jgi:hypothetical protein